MPLLLSGLISSCRSRFFRKNQEEQQGESHHQQDHSSIVSRSGQQTRWPLFRYPSSEEQREQEQEQDDLAAQTPNSDSRKSELIASSQILMALQQYRRPTMETIHEEDSVVDSQVSGRKGQSEITASSVGSDLRTDSYLSTSTRTSSVLSSLSAGGRSSMASDVSMESSSGSSISTSVLLTLASGKSQKGLNFIWDYAGRRQFQEAAALHSILSTHFVNTQQTPSIAPTLAATPPSTPLSTGSSSKFPVGDEDDVMSTITVGGGTSQTRQLVDQFAFIADAAVMKMKRPGKGRAVARLVEGTYWGEDEEWKEAERENMTAVCMEEWSRASKKRVGRIETGVTFRVAMNNGVPADVMEWLKGVAGVMENCARGVKGDLESEDILWSLVVEMNQRKIREDIIKRFYVPMKRSGSNSSGRSIENSTEVLTSKIAPVLQQSMSDTGDKLGQAVYMREGAANLTKVHQLCERIVDQGHKSGDVRIWKELLVQCYHLRRSRTFRAYLFSFLNGYDLFRTIQKLGRYRLAVQALIDAVRAHPHQFRNVEVHAIPTPSFYDVNSSIYPDADLRGYLRSILNTWRITAFSKENFEKIRSCFRERCADLPVVHAEMQLVKYYEENPMTVQPEGPTMIGCSKKPCQLCVRFIGLHGKFQVEKSHARISHRWAMPNMQCKTPENMAKIRDILESMTRSMEDSLRDSLSIGSDKKSKLREVVGPLFAAPQELMPKNAGWRGIVDIPPTASWDSGFVESMSPYSAHTESLAGGTGDKTFENLHLPRRVSDPVTPPPSRSLNELLPNMPGSPPPLRRRRRSPISLKEEYKNLRAMDEVLQQVPPRSRSVSLGSSGSPSPPPSSPLPIMHRPSSPTLGWNTRFPRHSIDSSRGLRDSLVIPPTPPPDSGGIGDEESPDLRPVSARQLYHGDQLDSGVYGTDSDQTSPEAAEKQAVAEQQGEESLGVILKNCPESFPILSFGEAARRSRRPSGSSVRSVTPAEQKGECIMEVPQAIRPLQGHILLQNQNVRDSFFTTFPEASPSGPVDIQILDHEASPHATQTSNRLPTPPEVDVNFLDNGDSAHLNRPHPFSSPRSELQERHKQPQPVPPKHIPHILISSPAARLQRQHDKYHSQHAPSTNVSTSTPPSTPSSSTSSLNHPTLRERPTSPPALSRRQQRSRHPLSSSSNSSLLSSMHTSTIPSTTTGSNSTSHHPFISNILSSSRRRPQTPPFPQTVDTTDSSSYTYWTSNISSTVPSRSPSRVASPSPTSNTAVPLRRRPPMSINRANLDSLEQEVGRVIRESGALNPNRQPHSYHTQSTYSYQQQHQPHSHRNHTQIPSSTKAQAPGVKSFLLRATNNKQNQQESQNVSWISVDISEELLRGSERFQVTAQLLPKDNAENPVSDGSSTRRHRSAARRAARAGEGFNGIAGGINVLGSSSEGCGVSCGLSGGSNRGNGLVLRHEYKKDEELLILDIGFGGAVLRLKIYW